MTPHDLPFVTDMPIGANFESPRINGAAFLAKETFMAATTVTSGWETPPPDADTDPTRKIAKLSDMVKTMLETVGEDASREGLVQTPKRFAKALLFLTKGYGESPAQILRDAVFHEKHSGLVLVKNITFSSLCEHHLVPFLGKVHIGYIPDGRVVGLSKMARLADAFARRLQVQERMTQEIASCMMDVLKPRGVAVVVEATHLCMVMRGVQQQGAVTTTTCMLGEMDKDEQQRDEFWKALALSQ